MSLRSEIEEKLALVVEEHNSYRAQIEHLQVECHTLAGKALALGEVLDSLPPDEPEEVFVPVDPDAKPKK